MHRGMNVIYAEQVELHAVVYLVEDTPEGPSRSTWCEVVERDGRHVFTGGDLGDELVPALELPDDGRRVETLVPLLGALDGPGLGHPTSSTGPTRPTRWPDGMKKDRRRSRGSGGGVTPWDGRRSVVRRSGSTRARECRRACGGPRRELSVWA